MEERRSPSVPPADRARWVMGIRRRNEELQDAFEREIDDDAYWSEIEDTHRRILERFLSMLPIDGRVLDAACGTGTYFSMVLASGRSLLGIDQSAAMLARAEAQSPQVPTEKHDLQDLPYREEFDGVMCVDAMEGLPPEDWPVVLHRFRGALRRRGWLYLTVELSAEGREHALDQDARRSGLPVVEGEWAIEPDGYYHFYPTMEQVREWVTEAGFGIEEEAEGPWHDEGYAYHHVLARGEAVAGLG